MDRRLVPIRIQAGDTTIRVRGDTARRLKLLRLLWEKDGLDSVIQRLLEPHGSYAEMLERMSKDARVRNGLRALATRGEDDGAGKRPEQVRGDAGERSGYTKL